MQQKSREDPALEPPPLSGRSWLKLSRVSWRQRLIRRKLSWPNIMTDDLRVHVTFKAWCWNEVDMTKGEGAAYDS